MFSAPARRKALLAALAAGVLATAQPAGAQQGDPPIDPASCRSVGASTLAGFLAEDYGEFLAHTGVLKGSNHLEICVDPIDRSFTIMLIMGLGSPEPQSCFIVAGTGFLSR